MNKYAISRSLAIVIIAIIVIAAAGVVIWLAQQPPAPTTPTTATQAQMTATQSPPTTMPVSGPSVIKVGLLLPYTGTFAAVARTQDDGFMLAVKEINDAGGLQMPWGRVRVDVIKRDDEASLDTGIRRFRELVNLGVVAVFGQTWAPLILALNNQILTQNLNVLYFPLAVSPTDLFKNGSLSRYTFPLMNSAYAIGYAMASYAIENLGARKIFFLARSDFWGWDMANGTVAAINDYRSRGYDVQLVGYDEAPLGNPDFTPQLRKLLASDADTFMFAQFGADTVTVLKQANELGVKNKVKIVFVGFITNAAAVGVPPEALSGVYALHWFYIPQDPSTLLKLGVDNNWLNSVLDFARRFNETYGYPPDAYAVTAYTAAKLFFEAVQRAGSLDPSAIANVINARPQFYTLKGNATIRIDHQVVYQYMFFVVRGKEAAERSSRWDLFTVVGVLSSEKFLYPPEKLGYTTK